jgi:hypothetical protein
VYFFFYSNKICVLIALSRLVWIRVFALSFGLQTKSQVHFKIGLMQTQLKQKPKALYHLALNSCPVQYSPKGKRWNLLQAIAEAWSIHLGL